MNIFDFASVPIEIRNIPAFLLECILSNTNCTIGFRNFRVIKTASKEIPLKKYPANTWDTLFAEVV